MIDRVIALSALAQSLRLVHQLATLGQTEQAAESVLLDSLFRFEAEDVEDIYGGRGDLARNLDRGLRELLALLGHGRRDPAVASMGATLLAVERAFMRHPQAGERVQAVLRDVERQRQHLGPQHPTVFKRLADLYSEVISPLGPRVLVRGNPVYLGQPQVIAEVRSLLLCGLRAAVLWRQVGGSRWDFLLRRRAMVEAAHGLLSPLD
ncbi:high frequency lysogenization protein HflD [Silanimonas lenta]|jgi:high frequency lysogenization protein|uniref:high frequency lysogenization protein HflD n=1 Tax=Silanimonas lenta TaxID=265429 RepID=UPI000423DB76|nr:high frequency lysogenization protein HflD [Silanimonas lenta]